MTVETARYILFELVFLLAGDDAFKAADTPGDVR
jgi:hypothetical protein